MAVRRAIVEGAKAVVVLGKHNKAKVGKRVNMLREEIVLESETVQVETAKLDGWIDTQGKANPALSKTIVIFEE